MGASATSLYGVFSAASAFTGSGIGSWDVSKVANFEWAFGSATLFETDLSGWNTASATTLYCAFIRASAFTGSGVGSWDVSKVDNFGFAFEGTTSFETDLSGWNTASATNFDQMFRGASSFTGSGIGSWDVSKVANFEYAFFDATSFATDLSGWDTTSATNFYGMFYGASSFTGSGIGSWDVSKVTSFQETFSGASSFNEDLCSWGTKITSTTAITSIMFSGTACATTTDPDLTAFPKGPFCAVC